MGRAQALAPGVTTPEVDRIARGWPEGGGAAKVCGAGGGGMASGRPGRPGAAAKREGGFAFTALAAGFRIVPFRVDGLGGLEVDVESGRFGLRSPWWD